MRHRIDFKRMVVIIMAVAVIAAPSAVSAQIDPDEPVSSADDNSMTNKLSDLRKDITDRLQKRMQQQRDARENNLQDTRADLYEKLQGAKKRVCEKVQATINRIMDNMSKRHENVFDRLSKITIALEDYYEEKGLSSPNHTRLSVTVDVAQVAAQNAMDSQQAAPHLDCSGEHPRAVVAEFKSLRLDSVDAMRTYKDAVRSLAKDIRNAAQEAEGVTS